MEEEELFHYPPMKPFAIWNATDRDVALGIQISFFECGGIAIGVCLSHKVADLMSLVTFVNAWAATCRGEKELVLQPMFDLGSHYFPPKHNPPFAKETDETSAVVNEKLVTKRFLFDKEKLDELKALASSATNAEVKDPTRVEVVSAYISKTLLEINQAKSSPKTTFAFSQSVNLRSRLTMSQHDQSFASGNFSALSLSASFMYKKGKKCHDLVSDVRTVTRKFNNYPEEDVVNNVVSANDPHKILAVIKNPNTLYCHFTSGCRLPFHEVDYGWGKPLSVCAPALPVKNRVILMDAKYGEGIQALVTMADEDMKLLPDELLSLETIDLSN